MSVRHLNPNNVNMQIYIYIYIFIYILQGKNNINLGRNQILKEEARTSVVERLFVSFGDYIRESYCMIKN